MVLCFPYDIRDVEDGIFGDALLNIPQFFDKRFYLLN